MIEFRGERRQESVSVCEYICVKCVCVFIQLVGEEIKKFKKVIFTKKKNEVHGVWLCTFFSF